MSTMTSKLILFYSEVLIMFKSNRNCSLLIRFEDGDVTRSVLTAAHFFLLTEHAAASLTLSSFQ